MVGRGKARESAPEAAVKRVPRVCREANLAVRRIQWKRKGRDGISVGGGCGGAKKWCRQVESWTATFFLRAEAEEVEPSDHQNLPR